MALEPQVIRIGYLSKQWREVGACVRMCGLGCYRHFGTNNGAPVVAGRPVFGVPVKCKMETERKPGFLVLHEAYQFHELICPFLSMVSEYCTIKCHS